MREHIQTSSNTNNNNINRLTSFDDNCEYTMVDCCFAQCCHSSIARLLWLWQLVVATTNTTISTTTPTNYNANMSYSSSSTTALPLFYHGKMSGISRTRNLHQLYSTQSHGCTCFHVQPYSWMAESWIFNQFTLAIFFEYCQHKAHYCHDVWLNGWAIIQPKRTPSDKKPHYQVCVTTTVPSFQVFSTIQVLQWTIIWNQQQWCYKTMIATCSSILWWCLCWHH